MNGDGFYKHSSGYLYEGCFTNGIPTNCCTKLEISVMMDTDKNGKYQILEGEQFFKVNVKCLNENNELFLGLYKNAINSIFCLLILKFHFFTRKWT